MFAIALIARAAAIPVAGAVPVAVPDPPSVKEPEADCVVEADAVAEIAIAPAAIETAFARAAALIVIEPEDVAAWVPIAVVVMISVSDPLAPPDGVPLQRPKAPAIHWK